MASATGLSPSKGRVPGGHLEHEHAERVQVRSGLDRLALRLLGRQIVSGAQDGAGFGHGRRAARPGYAEVGDLHPALVVDDDVLGLDVAVDDVPPMGEAQRFQDLDGDRDHQFGAQRGVLEDDLFERAALEILHRDVVGAFRLSPIVDLHDVGVVEAGGAAGFTAEALDELLVVRVTAGEDLEGDLAVRAAGRWRGTHRPCRRCPAC